MSAAAPFSLVLFAEYATARGGPRDALHERLQQAIGVLNARYAEVLRARWESIGDGAARAAIEASPGGGAGGVEARAARVTEMGFELVLRLQPLPLRLGIGGAVGKEAVALAKAREACAAAARARLFAQARGLEAAGAPRGSDAALGGAWAIAGALLRSWTDRQSQFVRWLLRDGVLDWRRDPPRFVKERRRKEVAAAFGVSPSVVTESLQAADVDAFRHALWAAAWTLGQACAELGNHSSEEPSASSSSMILS